MYSSQEETLFFSNNTHCSQSEGNLLNNIVIDFQSEKNHQAFIFQRKQSVFVPERRKRFQTYTRLYDFSSSLGRVEYAIRAYSYLFPCITLYHANGYKLMGIYGIPHERLVGFKGKQPSTLARSNNYDRELAGSDSGDHRFMVFDMNTFGIPKIRFLRPTPRRNLTLV